MTHAELINWALGVHGIILAAALTSYFKSVDNKLHKTSFDMSKETKKNITQKILTGLSEALSPVFSKPNDEVIKVLEIFGPDGEAWKEEYTETVNTEIYRNALNDFTKPNASVLADICKLDQLRERCIYWSGFLNKAILGLLIFQIMGLALTVIEKVGDYRIDDGIIISTIIISSFMIIACFLSLPFLNYYHEKLDEYAIKYN